MAGLARRIFPRQFAPLPSTHKMPLSTARISWHGRPRPSERRRAQNRFDPLPLGITEFPPSLHTLLLAVSSRHAGLGTLDGNDASALFRWHTANYQVRHEDSLDGFPRDCVRAITLLCDGNHTPNVKS